MLRIRLEPNQPITLKLVDPYADSCERYDAERGVGEYRTTDGRILALPRPAVLLLNELNPAPGEEIGVCKRVADGEVTGTLRPHIEVWFTPRTEKARAESEPTLQHQLEASIKAANTQKRRNGHTVPIRKDAAQTILENSRAYVRDCEKATGTDGPAPMPKPAARLAPATKGTPYPDMLRHIVRTVEQVLKAEGLQLGDGPKQDLISTVYIDAAKRSGVEYDFTMEGR